MPHAARQQRSWLIFDVRQNMNFTAQSLMSWVVVGNVAGVRGSLAAGADPSTKDEMGRPALHEAVLHRKMDIVSLLIAAGADIRAKDSRGYDVMLASACDDVGMLDFIEACARDRKNA